MPLQYQLAYTMQGAKWFVLLALFLTILLLILNRIRSKKNGEYFGTFLLTMGMTGVYISALFGYAGKYDGSMWLYGIALLCILTGYLFNSIIGKKYCAKTAVQLLLPAAFAAVWYFAAISSKRTIKEYPSLIVMGCLTSGVGLLFWSWQVFLNMRHVFKNELEKKNVLKTINGFFIKRRWLLLLLLSVCFFSIDTLNAIPMWDGTDYMQTILEACRWEFSLGTISNLDLCFHKAGGYALFSVLGAWLFTDATFGVHFIQLIMVLITVAAFWKILDSIFPKMDEVEKVLFTAVFAFSPALLGMMPNINVDFAMLLYITWMLCCYYNEWKILELLSAMLLCFTKESAIFIYAGFAVGIYFVHFIKHRDKFFRRIVACMKPNEYIRLVFPAFTWLATFLLSSNNSTQQGAWGASTDSYMKWNGKIDNLSSAINSFGYSSDYILNQTGHIFMMNFLWLLLIVILFAGIYCIMSKTRRVQAFQKLKVEYWCPWLISLLFFCLIMFFYVTHNHYRYAIASFTIIVLCFSLLLYSLIQNKVWRKIIVSFIAVLFLLQTFFSIDPLTNMMGRKINTGESIVINYDIGMAGGGMLSDYILYNRQGSDWGRLIEKAMMAIDCDETTLILIPEMQTDMIYQIFGFFASRDKPGIYWNRDMNSFSTIDSENHIRIQCGELRLDGSIWGYDIMHTLININPSDYEKVFFLNLPFANAEDGNISIQNMGYTIINMTDISYRSWKLKIEELGGI